MSPAAPVRERSLEQDKRPRAGWVLFSRDLSGLDSLSPLEWYPGSDPSWGFVGLNYTRIWSWRNRPWWWINSLLSLAGPFSRPQIVPSSSSPDPKLQSLCHKMPRLLSLSSKAFMLHPCNPYSFITHRSPCSPTPTPALCFPNTEIRDTHCSGAQSCPTLCDPMDCSTPGFPVLHYLLESAQTHVHWVDDTIQPSYPLLTPSPALNLSQHQGLFQWVLSSHQVTKVLELQLQHQSFQWRFRTDFL